MTDAETKAPIQIFIGKYGPESRIRGKGMKCRRLENHYEDELWSWTEPLAEGSWLFKSCPRNYMKDASGLSTSGKRGNHVSRSAHVASAKGKAWRGAHEALSKHLSLKCLLRWTTPQPIRLRVTMGKTLEAPTFQGTGWGSRGLHMQEAAEKDRR